MRCRCPIHISGGLVHHFNCSLKTQISFSFSLATYCMIIKGHPRLGPALFRPLLPVFWLILNFQISSAFWLNQPLLTPNDLRWPLLTRFDPSADLLLIYFWLLLTLKTLMALELLELVRIFISANLFLSITKTGRILDPAPEEEPTGWRRKPWWSSKLCKESWQGRNQKWRWRRKRRGSKWKRQGQQSQSSKW